MIARCESVTEQPDGFYVCRLHIDEVIKGEPSLKDKSVEVDTIEKISAKGTFWLLGYGQDSIDWVAPTAISTSAVPYLRELESLADEGPQRLEHFLRYLRHDNELVSDDAYNEFAEASMKDIASLKAKLDRTWVLQQLRDTSISRHRRRLFWTLLGHCGTADDARLFDELLRVRASDPTFDPGMDAAIACLITLGGESALVEIEKDYLANPDVDYSEAFAAISAIRVHGTDLSVLRRDRLAQSLRIVLQQPDLSDLVIPDLARWEDWSAIDRVAELFESTTDESSFIKPKVVQYLKACPLPAAATKLDRLRRLDPDAVRAAEESMMFYSGLATLPVPPPDESDDAVESR
ncbi:hypothetical protein [Crateriforma spongiae]|uniref:hypothetical protein n=1 Tax=Crateriforma spongiae TaxID=2724528 RepID=UPI001445382A|nr:hypothetical protein [Crateriforma spongiae]